MTSTDNITASSEPANFDIYARPFIPQALRNVNEASANVVTCTQTRSLDFDKYTSTFAGTDSFVATGPDPPPEKLRVGSEQARPGAPNGHSSDGSASSDLRPEYSGAATDVAPSRYHEHFRAGLGEETASQQSECEDHALYRHPIIKADPRTDPRPSVYILNVPGLREMSLRIEVGDIVKLRQIRFNQHGEVTYGSLFKDKKGRPINLPRKQDFQHNSVVWGIDRTRENLFLRIDNLTPRSMLFNVRFTTQFGRFRAMYNAISRTQNALLSDESWERSILFPRDSDGYYQKTLNRRGNNFTTYDELLNYEQSKAVNTVLHEVYGPVSFIISGPPGTGKTKTLVELALQLVAKSKEAHLLICAPSDQAADTLVERLSKHLGPTQLLRINAPSRGFPEVPNNILPYCFIDDDMFSLPPFEQLMKKSIVVTTCRDADILVRARVTNADLCSLEQRLHSTIYTHEPPSRPQRLHWTALLLDEAAQATEPEAIIPLTVISPPGDHNIPDQNLPQLILAGDNHQLGPRTASKSPAIATLFTRLLSCPFYAGHLLARSQQTGGVMRPLTQAMLPILRPAFSNLIRNYRSHPAILAVPSKLFYNDTLEPCAPSSQTSSLLSWSGWKGRKWPVLFSVNTGADEVENLAEGGGWYNVREAEIACGYAASFLQSGLMAAEDICIMSPFRAQVRVLRKLARSWTGPGGGMSGLNIGPLEAFQGLEKRVVILCTTRTRDRFLEQDLARGLGVIHEPKRFNVAVTRAMHGLVVIGNPTLLEEDPCWREMMGFSARNGLWEDETGYADEVVEGLREGGGGRGGGVSRLERQMVATEEADSEAVDGVANGVRRLGVVRDAEHEMWESGIEAERALVREK